MPSAEDILQSLVFLAQNYLGIAIIWHIVIYGFFLFLVVTKRKPSNRFVGCFLAVPLFSVSFFAWWSNNPFSGLMFLIFGSLLVVFSLMVKSKEIILNPSYVFITTGIAILFFGMIYPHFLGPGLFIYLYAAPVGIIPCATLLTVTGFSLIVLLKLSRKWMATLLIADLFYGSFGVFRLHVHIDILLLFASCLLFIQLRRQRSFADDSGAKAVGKGSSLWKTTAHRLTFLFTCLFVGIYIFYPWICRLSVTWQEAKAELPGDEIVKNPTQGYTMGTTIMAPASRVWPWLVQMGQGKGGFYTHEWVENILGADIHNADSILPRFQVLEVGDTIRLTPDPYFRKQGQSMRVALVDSPFALVYKQVLPNGSLSTWSFTLRDKFNSTRLLFRRRGQMPAILDRVLKPGYYFMDNGMLSGIKQRVELTSRDIHSKPFSYLTPKSIQ